MEIEEKKIKDIKPYENNPRNNSEAVEFVANSIKAFGFNVPIVIDRNGVIVAGHTRYEAAKRLKLKTVPCIRKSDLTDEQINAYRLADNKVAERATWDAKKLNAELNKILNIDMSEFDFDIPDPLDEDDGYFGDERERTYDEYNLREFDESEAEGFYQMPVLKPVDYTPRDLIGFNYMLTAKEKNVGIHFYVDDYQFERVWNAPAQYLPKLAEFDAVLTPDFSLYLDMPVAMKIWNVYRSRMLGQMLQRMGATVIPTAQWAEKSSFAYCFDGMPHKSTISVSTVGVKNHEESIKVWREGCDEMIKRLEPARLLIYGGAIDYDYQGIETVYYENHVTERLSKNVACQATSTED